MNEEQQYSTGFNAGYLLAKYDPELLVQVTKNLTPVNDYVQGFFSGKEEYAQEKNRQQVEELRNIRTHNKERGNELDRDK